MGSYGKNIHTFMGMDFPFEEAQKVVFGAPFDGTVSNRPGTRFGPSAMRQDFDGLEEYSPRFGKSITDAKIYDGGNLDLPFGNTEAVLEEIRRYASGVLENGKKFIMLGGEHLVTLPAFQAAAEKFPGLSIIHFDAHADLRDTYMGEKLSHATVMRRCREIQAGGPGELFQLGIRSGTKEEFCWAEQNTSMEKFTLETAAGIKDILGNRPVYLSLDLDVLDPSVMPGTGTPEPGGVSFRELHGALINLEGLNIVAADIVELAPHYDHSGISTAAACKILRELLFIL